MDPNEIKIDSSPTGSHRFTFSRTSSTGSAAGGCTSSASSAHNTGGHANTDQMSPTPAESRGKMITRQTLAGARPKRVIVKQRTLHTQTPAHFCNSDKAKRTLVGRVRSTFECSNTDLQWKTDGIWKSCSGHLPNMAVSMESVAAGTATVHISTGTQQRSVETQTPPSESGLRSCVAKKTSKGAKKRVSFKFQTETFEVHSSGSGSSPSVSGANEALVEALQRTKENEASLPSVSEANEATWGIMQGEAAGLWPNLAIEASGSAVEPINSSTQQRKDDEDSDSSKAISYKDQRREAHTVAEQKRRDAIKKGYDELLQIVPTCHQQESLSSQKMSKATVLQKSIDYMQFLSQQKSKQEEELDSLRKEVMALKIMKANYEHIVKTHQNTPAHGQNQVSDEVKFQVFQQIMDALFQSFNSSISVANFAELSACVFSWLEEYCKPQALREAVMTILTQLNSQLTSSQ